jgi:putative transport protein
VEITDVFVTNKEVAGKTLAELSQRPSAHGVFLRKITRNMIELPILSGTEIYRGDILTLVGSKSGVDAAAKDLGYAIGRPRPPTSPSSAPASLLAAWLAP